MIGLLDRLSRPFIRALDPEDAHRLAIKALSLMPIGRAVADPPELAVRAFGLEFPNPLGFAAGFDKNALAADVLLHLGFGFVEIGTVTPHPQAGNVKPRIFRLETDGGIINRLGFNNDGASVVRARLQRRSHRGGIIGVNIGANRDSIDRIGDYVKLIETFAEVASYFTINISSPNTPGLRDLQQSAALDELLVRIMDARERGRGLYPRVRPILLKIAPDLTLTDLDDIVAIARRRGIDGMIISNTTVARPPWLREREVAREQGGLSGRPLFRLSTRILAETFVRAEGAFPLIGVGGIDTGISALAKIKAGATLIQIYTGLVYRGIGLVKEIKNELVSAVKRERNSLSSMVGQKATAITAESWPP